MYNLLRNKVLIGVILYLVPFAVTFLIFRLFSWIVEPSYSIENALYAYFIYIGLLILSFIGSFFVAISGTERSWLVRFFFAIIAIFQFMPVMVLAAVGAMLIYVYDQLTEFAPISLYDRMKRSRFGCTVTSILAAVSAFALMLFVVEKGNVRTSRRIGKAVLAVGHIGSGDYFAAALLAMLYNWRVMIGANLWKYKIFHWFFNAVGIPIVREEGAHEKRAKAILASKNFLINNRQSRLIVFPQGTRERNPSLGIANLKVGAFLIAKELGIPVIPVTIIGTNKWRKPWKQDTTSHKGKKQNTLKLINGYIYQFFKTGISPTVVKIVYGNPISTVDKTIEEIRDEVTRVINQTYFAYTVGKKRDRKMLKRKVA